MNVEVVTISSSRFKMMKEGKDYSDEAGDAAEEGSKRLGFNVAKRSLISDDEEMIRKSTEDFLSGKSDVMLLTGGTGLSSRDITIETVRKYFEKELDGFGELLRRQSYAKVGAASALTRATAGVSHGKLLVCMPGSPDAVRTALAGFGGEIPHALFVARS